MNKYDIEYNRLMRKMERGGSLDAYTFKIDTPTGLPTKLTYIQQVLVRTTKFKEWFGDWEKGARVYVESGKHNSALNFFDAQRTFLRKEFKGKLDESILDINNTLLDFPLISFGYEDEVYFAYKNVSKVIDAETLEPRVLYHGTKAEQEFYEFNTDGSTGRPYAYFAYNSEYSENFNKSFLYECFLNVRDPFWDINFSQKEGINKHIEDIKEFYENKAKKLNLPISNTSEKITSLMDFKEYATDTYDWAYDNIPVPFWYLLGTDLRKILKNSLIVNGFDGVMFGESIAPIVEAFDLFRRDFFTRAIVIFEPNQVKLADGRNTDFNPFSDDIRYADGGQIENKEIMLPDTTTKYAHLRNILKKQGFDIRPTMEVETFEVGGTIKHEKGATTDGKKGGYFEGRSHADGGIKAFNVSTQTPIEVEGGEVIITKKAVDDDDLKEFEGEMLTNREILSRINQSGGGVAFEEGGEIHSCNCNGKKFAYGGETIEDYEIIRRLQKSYDNKQNMKQRKIQYGHNLMRKMKQGGFI